MRAGRDGIDICCLGIAIGHTIFDQIQQVSWIGIEGQIGLSGCAGQREEAGCDDGGGYAPEEAMELGKSNEASQFESELMWIGRMLTVWCVADWWFEY